LLSSGLFELERPLLEEVALLNGDFWVYFAIVEVAGSLTMSPVSHKGLGIVTATKLWTES
jgi:hypothetical protein